MLFVLTKRNFRFSGKFLDLVGGILSRKPGCVLYFESLARVMCPGSSASA